MRLINYLYKLYFILPNFSFLGKFGKGINRFLDLYVLRPIFNLYVPKYFDRQMSNNNVNGIHKGVIRREKYIVSMTSFPERIDESWISIMCLMNQTIKPDKIILWLANSQFERKIIPKKIHQLKNFGLEVKFCDDLRSHKKYFYSVQEFKDSFIFTFDDDLFYDSYVIENLISLKKKHPNCVVANRCHKMRMRGSDLLPYNKWHHNVSESKPSFKLFHTSGAGTILENKLLVETTFNKDLIKALSFNSDDVWLKMMCIKSSTKTVTNSRYNKDFITVGSTQKVSLVKSNTKKGMKDVQLLKVFDYFNYKLTDNLN
ncbi:MAG: hypothetical protein LAT51_06085 [Flavobacteriaceae bacterium]|nr:hypothetical protein [Flavobacteriaceae bacterium]